ncbi:MAG: hypothetical protein ISN28_06570 [Ectothiorhodospiraceae bacterium AqS1]|nr:hypothetical protein [Ectothiorhodospiraceae bacterium AqS1]
MNEPVELEGLPDAASPDSHPRRAGESDRRWQTPTALRSSNSIESDPAQVFRSALF